MYVVYSRNGKSITSTTSGEKELLDVNVAGSASGYAEDTPHAPGDEGHFILAVRKDSATGLASADGDYTGLIVDALNHLYTKEGWAPTAEDNSNGVIAITHKPQTGSAYAWSVDGSAALEASTVTKATPGNLHKALVRIDSSAGTDDYYIQFLNAAALPADGAVTHLIPPIKVQHTTGTDSVIEIDFGDNCIAFSTGLVMCISTTEFTKTIAGAVSSSTILFK